MSEHNEVRYGDEYQCAKCGKSWDVDDKDVPPCVEPESVSLKCDKLRAIIKTHST